MTGYTGHKDLFVRDHLPPRELWPEMVFSLPELLYPPKLNCAAELLDRTAASSPDEVCLITPTAKLTYGQLQRMANQFANVLVHDLGLLPGNRVLLRGPNHPVLVAAWFAVLKAGGVVVTTNPLLRAKELSEIIQKANITHALCDGRFSDELEKARSSSPSLKFVVYWGGDLEALAASKPEEFSPVETASDDPALIAFTSGTTGKPKGCVHFHRDVLAICDTFAKHILRPRRQDVFMGSPHIGFTYGLGGLVLFPMRVGAKTVLLERATPEILVEAIQEFRPTILFSSPTAYLAMSAVLAKGRVADQTSLRRCVSAGEALTATVRKKWLDATGIVLIDGIGSTEMLHIFISHTEEEVKPGAIGKPVPGYVATVLDEEGRPAPKGEVGRLAVKGPTGCRYLDDNQRQREYVQNGWNITGDAVLVDEDGYFVYQARFDDLIVSAGYNISPIEVEEALLAHPAVAECGVVGAPDPDRGQIVKAFVVLRPGYSPSAELVSELQNFVKGVIAPYKYPRAIEFCEHLPKTPTGKLQRSALHQWRGAPERGES